MFGGGENSAYASFAKANFDKFKGSTIDKDGNVMVPLLKRNEAGEYELDDSGNFIPEDSPTEIGSNSLSGGRFNMRTGVGNENLGMTKEDFDKANRFTQDVAIMNLNLNGASREKINQTATNAINTPPTLSDTEKTQETGKRIASADSVQCHRHLHRYRLKRGPGPHSLQPESGVCQGPGTFHTSRFWASSKHPFIEYSVLKDAIDGPESIFPVDLFSFAVGPSIIGDPHLIDPYARNPCNLGSYLGFKSKSILLQVDLLDYL